MRKVLDFTTTLDRDTIIQTLKENTYPTENNFLTLIFDKRYFAGEVNDRKIRIKNASRTPKNPSPILDITIGEKEGLTEVVIQDDTDDDIRINKLIVQSITISIAVVILLVGGILSFVESENYSLLWTLTLSLIVAGLGFINSYYFRETIKLNTRCDIDFLLKLLKR